MHVTIKATAPNVEVGRDANGDAVTESRSAEFTYNFPDSAAEAIEAFGDDTVQTLFIKSAKIQAQQAMRKMLESGRTPEEVAAFMETNWRPGAEARDPYTIAQAAFSKLTPEERQALLAEFRV